MGSVFTWKLAPCLILLVALTSVRTAQSKSSPAVDEPKSEHSHDPEPAHDHYPPGDLQSAESAQPPSVNSFKKYEKYGRYDTQDNNEPAPSQYPDSAMGYYSPYYGYSPSQNHNSNPYEYGGYHGQGGQNSFNHKTSGGYGQGQAQYSSDSYSKRAQNKYPERERETRMRNSQSSDYMEAYSQSEAAPQQNYPYQGPSYGYDPNEMGPGPAPSTAVHAIVSQVSDQEYGSMPAESGHRGWGWGHGGGGGGGQKYGGGGHGHGKGHAKGHYIPAYYQGIDNGIGLLALLSLLSLLQPLIMGIYTSTTTATIINVGRKKRSAFDNEIEENPHEGGLAKANAIALKVLPALNVIAKARQGTVPMDCIHQEVCNVNKVLVKELGIAGRYAGSVLSNGVVKMMEGFDSSSSFSNKLVQAGLAGRNSKKCNHIYPTCPALKNGGASSIPLLIEPENLNMDFLSTLKAPLGTKEGSVARAKQASRAANKPSRNRHHL